MIEVQVEHGEGCAAPTGGSECLVQALEERGSIGQPGQPVGTCQQTNRRPGV